ncbi:MAG: membrane protein insertase YidC [Gammaproteobacteria bacterium]|nr:membrane protein insertase YidC [Gammaproteobacteria bacterium]
MLTNIVDYLRFTLIAVLVVLGMMLYEAWVKDHPVLTSTATQTQSAVSNNYIPNMNSTIPNTAATPAQTNVPVAQANSPAATASPHIIHVTTDVLNVDIDAAGGNITKINLTKYPLELHSSEPVTLLNDDADTRYIAQSGLISATGPDTSKGQALYTSDKTTYALAEGQNEIKVDLNWQDANGVKVTKSFTFKRNDYEVNVNYLINNASTQPWAGNLYLQLMRKNTPPGKSGLINLTTYFGAAISSPEKPFQKIKFSDMQTRNLSETIVGGWAAMVQHYFVSAWVPEKNSTSQYFTRITDDNLYTVGMIGPKLTAGPGASVETQAKFYSGPAVADRLEQAAPNLQLTIDYGWIWFIAVAIFWMMQHIHSLVGNWGWSIVLVTLVIKLLFYQLSAKSYRSMSMLKKLQPRIATLKERFGADKQKFTQATIELYKKEKVNPMSGCLPILIQIPVFFGLYWVLLESVELRQAPWILWIHDLTMKDPYYILPVLVGISMFLQQRLNPPPPDPMQAKVMMMMPVVFTALFLNFPAGLMLYWFVNNSLSFLQQWYIMRGINANETPKKLNR